MAQLQVTLRIYGQHAYWFVQKSASSYTYIHQTNTLYTSAPWFVTVCGYCDHSIHSFHTIEILYDSPQSCLSNDTFLKPVGEVLTELSPNPPTDQAWLARVIWLMYAVVNAPFPPLRLLPNNSTDFLALSPVGPFHQRRYCRHHRSRPRSHISSYSHCFPRLYAALPPGVA